jgi:hypothetical protein
MGKVKKGGLLKVRETYLSLIAIKNSSEALRRQKLVLMISLRLS